VTTPADDYDRGHIAGGVDARLAGHDVHFRTINGSIERLANEMHALTLAVQRLGDQAISRDATVVTTAAALKDAEDARRSAGTTSWAPWAKLATGITAAAALVGVYLAFR
jgi:hypothetical protein